MNIQMEMNVDEKTHPEFIKWGPLATQSIWFERIAQNLKWGDGHFNKHPVEKILTILMEEVGEIARAILDHDEDNLLEETIQVAAVAQAFAEYLLKRKAEQLSVITTNSNNHCGEPIPWSCQ